MGTDLRTTAPLDWLATQLRWITVPSWLLSVIAHGLLAFVILIISQFPSCRGDFSSEGGDDFRKVGIRDRADGPANPSLSPALPAESPAMTAVQQPPVPQLQETPPVPLTLPQVPTAGPAPPVVGAGVPAQFDATQISSIIKPAPANPMAGTPANGGGGANGNPDGGTSFLGVSDRGGSFVYVIDRSSSMEEDGRLRAAKNELLASVEQLNESQRFSIIFYNAKYTVLKPRQERFDMFYGTDEQRLQVVRQLNEIIPEGGTLHYPALKRALEFKPVPDVIFLLTDGDPQSALTPKELDDIRILNNERAHIHCIEFGKGPISVNGKNAKTGNYLDQLAQENGGTYVYRNVQGLGTGF